MRAFLILLVVAALGLGAYVAVRHSARRPAASEPNPALRIAPNFDLIDLNGNPFHSSDHKNKVLLVNFWAAWCTPCADEVPQFVSLQQKYHDEGLQIIGISIDDSDSELRDFYRRYKINYPVIAGSQRIAQEYGGILGLPTTLVIRRDGDIEEKFVGATDFAMLEKHVVALLHSNP